MEPGRPFEPGSGFRMLAHHGPVGHGSIPSAPSSGAQGHIFTSIDRPPARVNRGPHIIGVAFIRGDMLIKAAIGLPEVKDRLRFISGMRLQDT